LQFHRSALIFDFAKDGTEAPEMEVGIEYHRLGKNLIRALLEGRQKTTSYDVGEKAVTVSLSEQFIPGLPKLKTASFIVPKRDRSTSWVTEETLNKKIDVVEPRSLEKTSIDSISDVEQNEELSEIETEQSVEKETSSKIEYDIMLGINGDSPQFGILGEMSGRKVALDLNQTHTISLFGVQGGGKSYTLGTIIEMASMQIQNINELPSPLATVVFHYSPTQDYAPEFTSMVNPNTSNEEIRILGTVKQ
jgi:hypothetical protein